MLRTVLAGIAGLVLGGVVIAAVQGLNQMLHPVPPGLDANNPADLPAIVAQLPLSALLGLELSYLAGSLAAGLMVGWIARGGVTATALVVGVLFTAANVMNLFTIPHPLWLGVLTTLTFVPAVWAGARIAAGRDRDR